MCKEISVPIFRHPTNSKWLFELFNKIGVSLGSPSILNKCINQLISKIRLWPLPRVVWDSWRKTGHSPYFIVPIISAKMLHKISAASYRAAASVRSAKIDKHIKETGKLLDSFDPNTPFPKGGTFEEISSYVDAANIYYRAIAEQQARKTRLLSEKKCKGILIEFKPAYGKKECVYA
jgi:hypothetical protein